MLRIWCASSVENVALVPHEQADGAGPVHVHCPLEHERLGRSVVDGVVAVGDAIGVRLRSVPFVPAKVLAAIKAASAGLEVTATEPVFGYMADALGFKMLNYDFQIKIMNDAEPGV